MKRAPSSKTDINEIYHGTGEPSHSDINKTSHSMNRLTAAGQQCDHDCWSGLFRSVAAAERKNSSLHCACFCSQLYRSRPRPMVENIPQDSNNPITRVVPNPNLEADASSCCIAAFIYPRAIYNWSGLLSSLKKASYPQKIQICRRVFSSDRIRVLTCALFKPSYLLYIYIYILTLAYFKRLAFRER